MSNDENLNPNIGQVSNYDPLRVKKHLKKHENMSIIKDKLSERLPFELQLVFTFYLTTKDIVLLLSNISKYWRKYTKDQKLW